MWYRIKRFVIGLFIIWVLVQLLTGCGKTEDFNSVSNTISSSTTEAVVESEEYTSYILYYTGLNGIHEKEFQVKNEHRYAKNNNIYVWEASCIDETKLMVAQGSFYVYDADYNLISIYSDYRFEKK